MTSYHQFRGFFCAGRVEVSTVLPRGFKSSPGYRVSWRRGGEARFHTHCWAALAKAARSTARKPKRKGRGKGKSGLTLDYC